MVTKNIPHDSLYKALFHDKHMVCSLLKDFVPRDFIDELDFTVIDRLPGEYITPGYGLRFEDVVWKIGWRGQTSYIALIVEFQTTQDKDMALRVQIYASLLLMELINRGEIAHGGPYPPVFPIVIYTGARPWTAAVDLDAQFPPMSESLKLYGRGDRYFLVEMSRVRAQALRMGGSLFAQVIRLERWESTEELEAVVRDLVHLLKNPEFGYLMNVFTDWVNSIVSQAFPATGNNMITLTSEEAPAMLTENIARWKAEYIQEGILIGRQEGLQVGRKEGLQVGRQEAKMESIAEVAKQVRFTVLSLLSYRFGDIPAAVISRMENISDVGRLQSLTIEAHKASSLSEFTTFLND